MESPLLSVCLITYNHVNYIRQAIDGVLMQQVNFSWELIIADDFSTDGTRDVLLEYRARFPDRIQLILQPRNVGASRNWLDLMNAPKSKYVAYFEGDDYWTDAFKLQKQVSFLEKHSEYVLSCHYVEIEDNATQSVLEERAFSVSEISNINIPTASVVFRNCIEFREQYFLKAPVGDLVLFVLLGRFGKIHVMAECMAVYRVSSQGLWSGLPRLSQLKRGVQARFWCLQFLDVREHFMQSITGRAKSGLFLAIRSLSVYHMLYFSSSLGRVYFMRFSRYIGIDYFRSTSVHFKENRSFEILI